MKKINWDKYQFHCSALGALMTKSRKKGELSETTKAYLNELYIKEVWGRERIESIGNKFMTKGTMVETDSISLFEKVTGNKYFKNNKQLSNELIVGTPDIAKPHVIDIKSSWDLYTFIQVTEEKALKAYYWQLLGYMILTDTKQSVLAYCLVDTPDILMNDELYRLSFKLPDDHVDQYKNNFIFSDIPEEMRVKKYTILFDDENENQLITNILQAREYMKSIKL